MKKLCRSIILILFGLAATFSANLPLHGDIGYAGTVGTLNLELEDSESENLGNNPVGTLNLELEESTNESAGNRPVGTLGLSLEGSESEEQKTEAVGTLQLELEDSQAPESEAVGTLNLELEGSDESESHDENPFSIVTDEHRTISISDSATEAQEYVTEAESSEDLANENENVSQASSAEPITETEEKSNAQLPEIVNKPAKTVEQIARVKELSEVEKLGFLKILLLKSGLLVKKKLESFNFAVAKMLEKTGKVSKEKLIGLNPPVGHKYEVCPENGLKTIKNQSPAAIDNDSIEIKQKQKQKKQKTAQKKLRKKKKPVKKQNRGTGTLNLELEDSSPARKSETTGSLGLELE